MTVEVKPDKKLFPSTDKLDPRDLEVPTRELFLDLKDTLSSIPQFINGVALAAFWKKGEVEFKLGEDEYSVRYENWLHPDSGYSTDFIRILRFGKWVEEKRNHESVEDIVISSGGPEVFDSRNTNLNSSISYSGKFNDHRDFVPSDSEVAIQKVREFAERLKKAAGISSETN